LGVIYVDSCIVIYAVEDEGPRGDAVRQKLANAGDEIVAISPLVTTECLTGPLRNKNLVLRDHYVRSLKLFKRLSVEEDQFIRAAELRARFGLKTPDALHLAAAQTHGCDSFWTNDNRLSAAVTGLDLIVFSGTNSRIAR